VRGAVDESETSYTSPPLANGTWYVHVAAYDPTGDCPINPSTGDIKCRREWSPATAVTIGPLTGAGNGADAATGFTSLLVAARQRAGALRVRATMGESGTITAAGSVRAAGRLFKLRAASTKAAAGKAVTLRPKLSKKALAAVKRALARHRKVSARLEVTARDGAGNTKTERRSVRLRA
jgi:hypothetical protein